MFDNPTKFSSVCQTEHSVFGHLLWYSKTNLRFLLFLHMIRFFFQNLRYDPQSAFELTLQWSVSTGSIITDLIHGWARKSQQSGFSLIPVPHDPFALPITKNSDPVRGPIFVELVSLLHPEMRFFDPSLLYQNDCLIS